MISYNAALDDKEEEEGCLQNKVYCLALLLHKTLTKARTGANALATD